MLHFMFAQTYLCELNVLVVCVCVSVSKATNAIYATDYTEQIKRSSHINFIGKLGHKPESFKPLDAISSGIK